MTKTRAATLLLVVLLAIALTGCGGGSGDTGGGAGGEPEEPPADADALGERYAALDAEVSAGVRDVGYRVERVLVDPDGDGPAEQLGNVLGPEDPYATEDDLFDDACTMSGVSCEVDELENLLENDREDFADEDEYHPDNCDVTTERDYYEGYDLAATDDGERYLKLREELEDASDGLAEDAEALARKAQRTEEVARDYEEASGYGAVPDWSAAEVEELAERAKAAEPEAEDALAAAEERWSMYEGQVEEVREEALALHDAEGC